MPARKGFSTRAVHAELKVPRITSQPVAVPIFQTASFAFDDPEGMATTLHDPGAGFMYTRVANPTMDALERVVADLEGAEASVGTASGMAAVHAVLAGLLSAGDHAVVQAGVYGNTFALFKNVLSRFGIEATFVDATDLGAVKAAIRPQTRVVYAESISNPMLNLADIPRLSEIAHAAKAKLVVDATFASPYLARPVEQGADIALHSATKYLGGHGDLIAGMVSGSGELIGKVRHMLIDAGGVIAPFTAWLVLRGVKTLPLRMARHCASALTVARWLSERRGVTRVVHPALPGHPQAALVKKLLPAGTGGMVGFEVEGGREAATKVMSRFKLFLRAASLGDAHSLAMVPAATSHRQLSEADLAKAGIPAGYVRLSVGLEDPEDLIADLDQALS